MEIDILCINKKGYLLAQNQNEELIIIDEYSGPLEPGDHIFVDSGKQICGKFDYVKNSRKYWLYMTGDIASEEDFMNL